MTAWPAVTRATASTTTPKARSKGPLKQRKSRAKPAGALTARNFACEGSRGKLQTTCLQTTCRLGTDQRTGNEARRDETHDWKGHTPAIHPALSGLGRGGSGRRAGSRAGAEHRHRRKAGAAQMVEGAVPVLRRGLRRERG